MKHAMMIALAMGVVALPACVWKDECVDGFTRIDGTCVSNGPGEDAGTDGGMDDDAGEDAGDDGGAPDTGTLRCVDTCPQRPHATTTCNDGVCEIVECEDGFEDCNGAVADGCEAELAADPDNCGSCGTTCGWDCDSSVCNNVLAVSAGGQHTCALISSGAVYCWGANGSGQLGDDSTEARPRPVRVEGLVDAATIGAGEAHTCAERTAAEPGGPVVCWGSNTNGQLGPDVTGEMSLVPADSGRTGFDLTVGGNHNCTRGYFGSPDVESGVGCWGASSAGQLSFGGAYTTRLEAGLLTSCGVRNGIRCVGSDTYGQLPPDTPPVELNDTVRAAAGAQHTCALLDDGTVWCWGHNNRYQIDTTDTVVRQPVVVPGVTGIDTSSPYTRIAIDAGNLHTCAIRNDRTVVCWGSNAFGQLGDGNVAMRSGPVDVMGVDDALELDTGANHSCIIREGGSVWCWGDNSAGQVGDGSASARRPAPVRVLPPTLDE